MSKQQVTSELRQWIVTQAKAGCQPTQVLEAMRASGWTEDVALQAIEDTLRQHLSDHARENGLPAPSPVPEPDLMDSPNRLMADGHEVSVVSTLRHPRVVVFGGLLTDDECDELVQLSRERLARSQTVDNATGGTEVNASRTSQGMFFQRGENLLCQRIEQRIAELVNWPVENGEGLQILRYSPGAEYKPHYDYFDPDKPGTPAVLKRGGQRVGTLIMYLNRPIKGGSTVFPDVKLEVAPVKGNAVFFSYDRPHPMTQTLHGGAEVVEGEKWVATKWLREGPFR
jgi:prolyl 4-hydroxylase